MNIKDILPDDMFPMLMTDGGTGETFLVEEDDPMAQEIMWNRVRMVRQSLLLGSDWTQTGDSPLTPEKVIEWAAYRAALRDMPQNYSDPKSVVFPEPPEA